MVKVCVIPDMHGSKAWEIVRTLKFDYCVSLGDWFDSFYIGVSSQIKNFENYMKWVKQDPEHRLTCIGNHDFAYLDEHPMQEISGHNVQHHDKIHTLLMNNIKYIKPYVKIDKCIFSHAGVSSLWLSTNHLKGVEDLDTPLWFKLHFLDFDMSCDDPYGDDPEQSLLWIRPESLIQNSFYPLQCIGHTELCKTNYLYLCSEDGSKRVIMCDSPTHDLVQIIDFDLIDKKVFTPYGDKF